MLRHLIPAKPDLRDGQYLDESLQALVDAAEANLPLEPVMREVVRGFGFDSFLYAMTTAAVPNRDSRSFYWANQPIEWVRAYDANAYVEVDPRIILSARRTTPLIWDSARVASNSRVHAFLKHAGRYGIRSGVACGFRDVTHARMGLILNSSISPVSEKRLAFVRSQLGQLMLFSARFHDLFMAKYIQRGAQPMHQGTPLSPREVQCLSLAARGMTSADIGIKLGITERTVNFHFCNIISKLNVLNRQEAIARGVASGIVPFEL